MTGENQILDGSLADEIMGRDMLLFNVTTVGEVMPIKSESIFMNYPINLAKFPSRTDTRKRDGHNLIYYP